MSRAGQRGDEKTKASELDADEDRASATRRDTVMGERWHPPQQADASGDNERTVVAPEPAAMLSSVTAPIVTAPSVATPSLPTPRPSRVSRDVSSGEDPYLETVIADRYRVIRKLGEGGMGVVYLAEHVFIEKKVALKILSEDFARKPELVKRFMQEAKAASKIGHENIVDITDFGETASGSVFFAMEFLDGMDLAQFIEKNSPMQIDRTREIMNQICRALGAAHSKGIVHRDLKPENIFLIEREGKRDFVKILDFGIAKMNAVDDESSRLTRTGMIFGTPEYMSPEQAKGDRPDHRVDIYAAGCILYEMLTGDVPFHAETFMGVLTKHMFEEAVPPSKREPSAGFSPAIDKVVARALAKDRAYRFQTMKEFAIALSEIEGGPMPVGFEADGSSSHSLPPSDATVLSSPTIPPGQRMPLWYLLRTRGRLAGPVAAMSVLALVLVAFAVRSGTPATAHSLKQETVTIESMSPSRVSGRAATPTLPKEPEAHAAAVQKSVVVPAPDQPSVEAPAPDPEAVLSPEAQGPRTSIKIDSTPQGAAVVIGDRPLGVTPLSISLPVGTAPTLATLRRMGFRDLPITLDPSSPYKTVELEKSVRIAHRSRLAAPHAPAASASGFSPPSGDSRSADLKDPFAR